MDKVQSESTESAILVLKPLAIAIGGGAIAIAEPLMGASNVSDISHAVGTYGLPTALVIYFVARDWIKDREHTKQVIKDKQALSKVTEDDKQRSYDARLDRDREQSKLIALERESKERALDRNHELQMAVIDAIRYGHFDRNLTAKISDSTTGKLVTKNQDNSQ